MKNKILIISLVFFCFGVFTACKKIDANLTKDTVIKLTSMNSDNFGVNNNDSKFKFLTNLVKNEHIFVMQELNTGDGSQGVDKLLNNLNATGNKWNAIITDRTQGTTTEKFGFLYREDILEYVLIPGTKEKVSLLSKYSSVMLRPPAIAIFRDKRTDKEFRITSVHLAPKNRKPQLEIPNLVGDEWFNYPNSIIVGDFNMSSKKMNDVFEKAMGFRHLINQKTSLKTRYDEKGRYLNEEYDNIYVREGIKVIESGVVDYIQEIGIGQANRMSDHLPVRIYFEVK